MARVRKIAREPADGGRNYFLLDANFLANRFIPPRVAPKPHDQIRIERSLEWWDEIESQVSRKVARVYIPDVCIAEAFKVFAKKYYSDKWFGKTAYYQARRGLREMIHIGSRTLKSRDRFIPYHDISTNRDVIISVDRFYRLFAVHRKSVSVVDLIVVATAKYLIDFYDIPKKRLHIITMDRPLWEGSKKIGELPNAYDPADKSDLASRIFA